MTISTFSFERALSNADSAKRVLDGDAAFALFSNFGLPVDITMKLAEDRGYLVDVDRFERLKVLLFPLIRRLLQ